MYFIFPKIDKVILHLWGPFSISWYSLAYVIGTILGYLYCKNLIKNNKLRINQEQLEQFINYLVIPIIGARLGYVFVYDNTLNILKIHEGGLSFHGGLIGIFVAAFIFAHKKKLSMFDLTDLVAAAAPIIIFFVRIANFINCELIGRPTTVPWAVLFPPDFIPRHPSQIYESLSEGMLIFIILNILIKKYHLIQKRMAVTGVFLILYGICRIYCELFRQPDLGVGFIWMEFTLGQILSFPMIIFGIFCLLKKNEF